MTKSKKRANMRKMDKSELHQRRCGSYERNLRIQKLVNMGAHYIDIGFLYGITKQRVGQIIQELKRAREKTEREWDLVRDGYGAEGIEENDR